MFIDDAELETSVFLVSNIHNLEFHQMDRVIAKLGLRNTEKRRVQRVIRRFALRNIGQAPPRRKQKQHQLNKKHQRKKAGMVSPRLLELSREWKNTTKQEKQKYINHTRTRDLQKDEPEVVTGKPIVMPAKNPYFGEASARLALEAGKAAALAKAQATAAAAATALKRKGNKMGTNDVSAEKRTRVA